MPTILNLHVFTNTLTLKHYMLDTPDIGQFWHQPPIGVKSCVTLCTCTFIVNMLRKLVGRSKMHVTNCLHVEFKLICFSYCTIGK